MVDNKKPAEEEFKSGEEDLEERADLINRRGLN